MKTIALLLITTCFGVYNLPAQTTIFPPKIKIGIIELQTSAGGWKFSLVPPSPSLSG